MAVTLAVYHERKALIWSGLIAGAAFALILAKGWVPAPEPISRWETPLRVTGALVVGIVMILATRTLTGVQYQNACSKAGDGGPVPVLPSAIPIVGHSLHVLWTKEWFLSKARDNVTQNMFGLNLLGTKHVILGSSAPVESIGAKESEVLDDQTFVSLLRDNMVGMPEKSAVLSGDFYEKVFAEANVDSLTRKAVTILKECVPDLVTFNESWVDQQPWERASLTTNPEGPDGPDTSESNLALLVRDFVGHIINCAVAGTTFTDDFPKFNSDLLDFETRVSLLATGLPRSVPVPGLPAAWIARRSLLANLSQLREAYRKETMGEDIISTEQDVGDFSAAYTTSQRLFAEHSVPPDTCARAHLYMFWALNASARDLAFWMLIHVLAEPGLADRILAEIQPYARAVQPPNDLGIAEPPQLSVDLNGLAEKCPLLASCYMETVRLYNCSWSVKRATQDVVLSDNATGSLAVKYLIKKGEFVDVSNHLLNTDSQYRDAAKFVPDRFVAEDETHKAGRADWGSVRHDNGMWRMEGVSKFAQGVCLATVASLLGVWKIEPAGGSGWKIPRGREGPLTARPKGDIRVRIGRRALASK